MNYELFSAQTWQGCLGCVSEEDEQQTGAQLNITKKSPALQTTHVCNLDFFFLFVSTFISRLYSHFRLLSSSQLLLFATSSPVSHTDLLPSSLAYMRAVVLLVLAVLSTCPPLPPTSRAFLLIQLNCFNYLTGHEMANICWFM